MAQLWLVHRNVSLAYNMRTWPFTPEQCATLPNSAHSLITDQTKYVCGGFVGISQP